MKMYEKKLKENYCCNLLKKLVQDPETIIDYIPKYREFSINSHPIGFSMKNQFFPRVLIYFCPFCGSQFLRGLSDKWFKILETKFGLEYPGDSENKDKIPKSFRTDEWWKKWQLKTEIKPFPSQVELYRRRLCSSGSFDKKTIEKMIKDMAFEIDNLKDFSCLCFEHKAIEYSCCPLSKWKKCLGTNILYKPETRQFLLLNIELRDLLHKVFQKTNNLFRVLTVNIYFCPWCGAKLPKSLAKEWLEAVSKKFGVTDVSNHRAVRNLPKKYLSDQWWKEAGM